MVPEGEWKRINAQGADACGSTWFIGLKTLGHDPETECINGHHIFFAHCFKCQSGWKQAIERFSQNGKGKAKIWDLEFMLDPVTNRRVAAFGYHAGYVGMALALTTYYAAQLGLHQLPPQEPHSSRESLFAEVDEWRNKAKGSPAPSTVVLGAKGAAGSGAVGFFRDYFATVDKHYADKYPLSAWDIEETQNIEYSRPAILKHDILINCINLQRRTVPFVSIEGLGSPDRRLSVISDVSCDPNNPDNPIPIYSEETEFDAPVLVPKGIEPPVHIIAVSHLPSLLPKEASEKFSQALLPHLAAIPDNPDDFDRAAFPVWNSTLQAYEKTLARLAE